MAEQVSVRIRKSRLKFILVALATAALVAPTAVWAADQFNDVPNSNIFHDDIAWMADNGVTAGCNPPANDEFCPGDNVTREQMAAFMRRLAEKRVVDAGTVDGFEGSELRTPLWADRDNDASGTSRTGAGRVEINSVSINAPTAGFLVVSGTAFLRNNTAGDRQFALNLLVDGSDALPYDWAAVETFETTGDLNRGTVDYTVTIPITAGAHTIAQEAGPYAGTADFFHNSEHLTVVFHPSASGSVTASSFEGPSDAATDPQG